MIRILRLLSLVIIAAIGYTFAALGAVFYVSIAKLLLLFTPKDQKEKFKRELIDLL